MDKLLYIGKITYMENLNKTLNLSNLYDKIIKLYPKVEIIDFKKNDQSDCNQKILRILNIELDIQIWASTCLAEIQIYTVDTLRQPVFILQNISFKQLTKFEEELHKIIKNYYKLKYGLEQIKILQTNILTIPGDVLVNPSGPNICSGGGLDRVICDKMDCGKIHEYLKIYALPNSLSETKNLLLPSFNLESYQSVLFVCTPLERNVDTLKATYTNIFTVFQESEFTTFIIPALGTGSFGFRGSEQEAAKITLEESKKFVQKHSDKNLVFTLDKKNYHYYNQILSQNK